MSPQTLIVLLLQTGVVLAAALVMTMLLRKTPLLRISVLRVALLAVVAVAFALPWSKVRSHPVIPVSYQPALAHPAPVKMAPQATPAAPQTNAQPKQQAPVVPTVTRVEAPAEPIDWIGMGLIAWPVGSLLLALQLCLGWLILMRLRRQCQPVTDDASLDLLRQVAKSFNLKTPALVEGDGVGNPFVAGVFQSTIYLPTGWLQEQTPHDTEAVLRHEVAHIANGDLRWGIAYRLIRIVVWPQALLWLCAKPITKASEELCDRHVLSSGLSDVKYADCLLRLREGVRRRPCPALGIGTMSGKSSLAERIESILDSRSRSLSVPKPYLYGLRGLVALTAVVGITAISAPVRQVFDPTVGWIKTAYSGKIEITDESGSPITGAQAWLQRNSFTQDQISLEVEGNQVVLPPAKAVEQESATLIVVAKGHALGIQKLWPAKDKVTALQLGASASVHGRLVLPTGKPAAGLKVQTRVVMVRGANRGLKFAYFETPLEDQLTSTTDASGAFLLKDMPDGAEVAVDVQDAAYAHNEVRLTAHRVPDKTATDLKLQLGTAIQGRVTRDGEPVGGVRVVAQQNHRAIAFDGTMNSGGSARTDENGNYTVAKLPPSTYNVIVYPDKDLTAAAHEAVKTVVEQPLQGMDFALTPGAVITGVVRSEDGQPVKGVSVGLYGPANPRSSGSIQGRVTDNLGRFTFHTPAGDQHLYVADSRYDMKGSDFPITDGETKTVNLDAIPSPENQRMFEDISPAPQPTRKAPAPAPFTKGPDNHGLVRLKNGGTVRLAYLQDDSSVSHNLWHPDGAQATSSEVQSSLNLKGFGSRGETSRILFARVEITGLKRGAYDCVVETKQPSERNVWQSYGDSANKTMDMVSFHAPAKLRQTDFRLGVAAEPYPLYARCKLGQAPLFAKASKSVIGAPEVMRKDKNVSITVQIPASLEGKAVQLVAYRKDGKPLELASWETESSQEKPGGPWTRGFGFWGGTANDVAYVELRAASYEWVTFRHVKLFPNG